MIISFLRAIIIYLLVIIALRFMGKRQIGELQPTELVVTILISEVASIPLENADMPLFFAFLPVIVIVCLEVIISGISMHAPAFRRLFTGKPIILIDNGTINQKALKSTRLSVADLLDTLRLKGYFDVQSVKYAILEMNGQLSVMPLESEAPASAKDAGIKAAKKEMPFTVVSDGKLNRAHFDEIGTDEKGIKKELKKENLSLKQVLLMTADSAGNYYTVKKDEKG